MSASEEPSGPVILVTVQGDITAEQLNACAAIVRGLPEWFGDADAVSAHLDELPKLDVYLALRNAEVIGFASIRRNITHVAEIHIHGRREEASALGGGKGTGEADCGGLGTFGGQATGGADGRLF